MASNSVTPTRGGSITTAACEAAFIRGIRDACGMINGLGTEDDHSIVRGQDRPGRQINAVRVALGRILMRGDAEELNGFCAALTWALAWDDSPIDCAAANISDYADRREDVTRRRVGALAARELA